eukprot:s631_g24.t1
MTNMSSELRKLRLAAHEEMAARERTQEALLRMCQDLGRTLRADVELELNAGSEAEDAMIGLLAIIRDHFQKMKKKTSKQANKQTNNS